MTLILSAMFPSGYFKEEGTTQTFGQLIIFPSKKDSQQLSANNIKSEDIVVNLQSNSQTDLSIFDIDESDRYRITVSAFSDQQPKTAFVTVNSNPNAVVLQEKNNSVDIPPELIHDFAIVVGSSMSKLRLKGAIEQASKVDFLIALKSQLSQEVEYNTIKQTNVKTKFVYNFYTTQEKELNEEDRNDDPLDKADIFSVPRYVKITWEPQSVTEPIRNIEPVFSVSDNLNKPITFTSTAKKIQLVDVHELGTKAFSSVATFGNTLSAVVSPKNALHIAPEIPTIEPL
jgi:hypothetical protein